VSGSAEPLGIEPRDELLGSELAELLAEGSPNGSTERLGSELAELFTEVCSPKTDNR